MKKILLFITLCAFLSIGARAQETKRENTQEIHKDAKALKEERTDRNKDIRHAKLKSAKKKQKKINRKRKDLNANKKELKNQGEKHPVEKAKEDVRRNG